MTSVGKNVIAVEWWWGPMTHHGNVSGEDQSGQWFQTWSANGTGSPTQELPPKGWSSPLGRRGCLYNGCLDHQHMPQGEDSDFLVTSFSTRGNLQCHSMVFCALCRHICNVYPPFLRCIIALHQATWGFGLSANHPPPLSTPSHLRQDSLPSRRSHTFQVRLCLTLRL